MISRSLFCTAILVMILAAVAPTTLRADTTYAISPVAHKMLTQMQATYSKLSSLTEQIVSQESPKAPYAITLHTQLRVQRPNLLSVITDSKSARSGSTAVISDGLHCYVTAPQHPGRYLKFRTPTGSLALSSTLKQGVTSGLTLYLFSDPSAVGTMFADSRLATLRVGKPERINGILTDSLLVQDVDAATLTLYIGRADHLIHKVIADDPNKPEFTELYTAIIPNAPLKPPDFAFIPPTGSQPFYGTSFDQPIQDAPN